MANTFNFGNGNWAQKTEKVLAYNAENNNYKPLPFDFDRGSSATRVNKQGLIETVGVDEPRIDFLNNTKGHLLLEPQRTNNFTDGNNVAETLGVGNATIIQNNNTSPTGTLSAAKFTENTLTNSHFARIGASITGQVAFSIFAKADGRNRIYLTQDFNNGVIFNVNIGVIDGYKGSGFTGNIEDYGNGWYRCIVYTTIASVGTLYVATFLDNSDNASYTGDGISSVLLYGAQLEAGSYATSYIPTQGETNGVTRSAESCSGAGNSTVFNDSEGVLYAEISALADYADNDAKTISIYNSLATNTVLRIYYYNTLLIGNLKVAGSNIVNFTYTPPIRTDLIKVALKYKQNDFAFWVNGVEIATETSGNTPTGLDTLDLSYTTINNFRGNVKDVRVYNTALTDAELIALTS